MIRKTLPWLNLILNMIPNPKITYGEYLITSSTGGVNEGIFLSKKKHPKRIIIYVIDEKNFFKVMFTKLDSFNSVHVFTICCVRSEFDPK